MHKLLSTGRWLLIGSALLALMLTGCKGKTSAGKTDVNAADTMQNMEQAGKNMQEPGGEGGPGSSGMPGGGAGGAPGGGARGAGGY